jgi:DNA-binding LacI/PurR family transcriptional regulator
MVPYPVLGATITAAVYAAPANGVLKLGSGKPTSLDIAYKAGVSQSTVSRALRDSPLVNVETRERIKRIAKEINYQVDHAAAGLRSQQSRTIALLLFEEPTTDDSQINPFFLAMLSNITRAAARRKYDVLLSFQQLSDDWHMEYEASNRADGIILLGYGDYLNYADKLQKLIDSDAHFVIWGPTIEGQSAHSVGCDNEYGAFQAVSHLVSLGRRNIAFLGGTSRGSPEFRQRYVGYCRALNEAGLTCDPGLQVDADSQEISGLHAVEHLLDSKRKFDAIFAASDLIAIGAIKGLRKSGLKVPADVAVVGFDDIQAASYVNPSLTTVRQDTRDAGEALVNNLVRMIHGESASSELLMPSLVVRSSCGGRVRDA